MRKRVAAMNAVKIGILLICIGLIGGILSFMIHSYIRNTAERHMVSYKEMEQIDQTYEAILILGAKVYSETSISDILKHRLEIGYQLYVQGVADKIIVSGDHNTEDYDEVIAMKHYLMQKGVPREAIYMDHAGLNTYDSMYRAKYVFCVRRIVAVTQEYHLFRAVYIGKKLGMETLGVTSDLDTYVNMRYYTFREYLARNKAFLDTEILHRAPKYEGGIIPIQTSSGLDTEDAAAKAFFDRQLRQSSN